jgi:hypothetical protein
MTDASRAEPAARTGARTADRTPDCRTPDWAAVRRRAQATAAGDRPADERLQAHARAAVRRLRLCAAHRPLADGFEAVFSLFGTLSVAP